MNQYWKDRPVLVTGAGGFIGSHLVETLVALGAKVRAFVRYNGRGDPGLLRFLAGSTRDQVEVISGDLRDLDAVQKTVGGISHVFHLGAVIAIPYSYIHPAEVVESNVIGTLNVLLACREAGVNRVIHTSSSEVYGTALRVPIDEQHPYQGQSPYSASKIGADMLADSFYRSFDLPVVTVRPFNTYGPRQSARAVIPTVATQVIARDLVRLGNLDTRRDFTFITDTVDGLIRAGQAEGVIGRTINLGSGSDISIADLVELIAEILQQEVIVIQESQRLRPEKSEVQRLLSDNRLAGELMDWKPRVSLTEGLQITLDWLREHLDLYQPGSYQL
jgi:dTDP-glucose 4,6-dehydratase